jgi:hypothetical protein
VAACALSLLKGAVQSHRLAPHCSRSSHHSSYKISRCLHTCLFPIPRPTPMFRLQVCWRSGKVQLNSGIIERRHQNWDKAELHFKLARVGAGPGCRRLGRAETAILMHDCEAGRGRRLPQSAAVPLVAALLGSANLPRGVVGGLP